MTTTADEKTPRRGPLLTDDLLPERLRGFVLLDETPESVVEKLKARGLPEPRVMTTSGTRVSVRLPRGAEPEDVEKMSFYFKDDGAFNAMSYELREPGGAAELAALYEGVEGAEDCLREGYAEHQAKDDWSVWCLAVVDDDDVRREVEVLCKPRPARGERVEVRISDAELYRDPEIVP